MRLGGGGYRPVQPALVAFQASCAIFHTPH
jgi:hypothetical protein